MGSIDKLLQLARKQREQGKPKVALNTFNEVLFLAVKKRNHVAIIQALTDRCISFRHLFEETSDAAFAILARKDAQSMLEMVKLWGVVEKLQTAYYMLGQASLMFQDFSDAENYFFKSLRYFKGNGAEKGSWRYHWAKSLYLIGEKKKSLLAFAQAINEIKKHAARIDPFLINTYLSGAYLNFAQVLMKDNPVDARKYLKLAKEIISSDKRLVVRKKQLLKLEKYFK
jgi:tetratricopeptide (TPR) repeat protein